MINPYIRLTGAIDNEPFYIDVTKIQGFCSIDDTAFKEGNSVIYDKMTKNRSLAVRETVEQITTMIQKYYDDCLIATLTSAALARPDTRVTDTVVMAKKLINRLKDLEGENNAP